MQYICLFTLMHFSRNYSDVTIKADSSEPFMARSTWVRLIMQVAGSKRAEMLQKTPDSYKIQQTMLSDAMLILRFPKGGGTGFAEYIL